MSDQEIFIKTTSLTVEYALTLLAKGETTEEIMKEYEAGSEANIQTSLLDRIENESKIALITREGHKDIAMLPADELANIFETLHLLRSPTNAKRLFSALEESIARDNTEPESLPHHTIENLRQELENEREE
ncbi:MAG: type II toxin-antitoxin system Phd/YefM family antitoxin [Xenococcaceae cyanobacterium MO_207.B15]|nr:type II toxin-antitoxin system Phd/YefM family antitoxin [Xenococcaceae cyanobacterium MO_207.B15]MDJ0741895.1 type II toxin-antitoxin system Phd/YefM family antitoxin [Xenococcaceae cyanobacterium MO_167.B27]